jgi:predicted metal-dependent hydrolase
MSTRADLLRRRAAPPPGTAQLSFDLATPVASVAPSRAPPPYRVRLSRRARSLQIEVTPWRGVEIIVPNRTSAKRVQAFVARNRSWIRAAWEELLALYPGQIGVRLPERVTLAALDEDWQVLRAAPTGARARIEADRTTRTLVVRAADDATGMELLRGWVRARATEVLPDWLARVADETGLSYTRAQVRAQRTRWGSCSTRGTIALNYKLLFVRPALVNYLMIHELCHTRHFDHSKRFWALVTAYLPDGRERDAELDSAWTAVPGWAGE